MPLLWTYLIKPDGTRKARCVCNGSLRIKGAITLGKTYAAALEQSGCRLFWALSALENFVIHGEDATNAYAEAPSPVAQLYVNVDKQYREWYYSKYKINLSSKHVLPVHHALQGHPESARLWSQHIHQILTTEFDFKSCPHEPCLYSGTFNNKRMLLLQQVDDFAVSSDNSTTINQFLDQLNLHLKTPLKRLKQLTSFNGIELIQSRNYIKVHCHRYIKKILEGHGWLKETKSVVKTPMTTDAATLQEITTSKGTTDTNTAAILQKKMGFKFRQCIGELLFAAVTCRPDIIYQVIYLSQFSCHPAEIHYTAVKRVYRYLRCTISEGIHYWRQSPRMDLPLLPDPEIAHDNHKVNLPNVPTIVPSAYADADWASNIVTRRSVSGSAVFLAGGPIIYRCKFQHCVALSSTESELYAASETAKLVRYVRSIMKFLGYKLDEPTSIFEDNAAMVAIGNSDKPTKRLRHVDIRHFSIVEWIQQGYISLLPISTHDNPADSLTKNLGPQLQSRYCSTMLGKRRPPYLQ